MITDGDRLSQDVGSALRRDNKNEMNEQLVPRISSRWVEDDLKPSRSS